VITRHRYDNVTASVILLFLVAACGGSGTRVTKTMHASVYRNRQFSNVLFIAAADNYDARAQFERTVVSAIRQSGAEATAYYTVFGRNSPISVSDITNAVRSRGFDSVLFTRVKDSTQQLEMKDGQASAQAVAKGGNLFDLFRYDYEEIDAPENLRVSTSVVLVSELYDAAAQTRVWAVETASFDRESVGQIVDSAAQAVVKALRRDDLVGKK